MSTFCLGRYDGNTVHCQCILERRLSNIFKNICSSDTEIQDGEYPERLVPTKVEIYPTKVSHAFAMSIVTHIDKLPFSEIQRPLPKDDDERVPLQQELPRLLHLRHLPLLRAGPADAPDGK